MVQVQLRERHSVRASETLQAQEGETQVVINLPEAVPTGKVLNLRIEIAGAYGEPKQAEVPPEPAS